MNQIILKAENISKQYRLGLVGTGALSDDLKRWWHKMRGKEDPFLKIGDVNDRSTKGISDYVWALQDINFEIKKGEVLGIIGKNGAGKSTLLKILSRVTSPTTGEIKTKGRIASLLEVGTGFHPELTGLENIYLNGAILGMTKAEIKAKEAEIIEFSGCERYIDTPVKRYSSGMYVRLAFAVAAFLEPDILVIDEVLAVGDAEFQKKAIGKMKDISEGDGRTVIFVSHNMNAIKNLCKRALLIEHGKIVLDDHVDEVLDQYLIKENVNELYHNTTTIEGENCNISDTKLSFTDNLITNGTVLKISTTFFSSEARTYSITCQVDRENALAFVATSFYKETPIHGPGAFEIEVVIPQYLLNPGFHTITISFVDGTGNSKKFLLNAKSILSFNVNDDNYRRGGKYVQGWAGAVSPLLDITWKKMSDEAKAGI